MCFEQLYESAKRNELTLIDGGMCHWHLRRDGQLTIREIIATRRGAGTEILNSLRQANGMGKKWESYQCLAASIGLI